MDANAAVAPPLRITAVALEMTKARRVTCMDFPSAVMPPVAGQPDGVTFERDQRVTAGIEHAPEISALVASRRCASCFETATSDHTAGSSHRGASQRGDGRAT